MDAPTPPRISLGALFLALCGVSLVGFGGVMPWARRMLVERRRWLGEREFLDLLSLCQFLPGPNIVNLAVCLGARHHGALGSLVGVAALLVGPFGIVLVLAELYGRYGGTPNARGALAGISASAAGLVVGMALRMAKTTPLRRRPWAIAVALCTFLAVGVLRWPLGWVLLVGAPLSVALAWRRA